MFCPDRVSLGLSKFIDAVEFRCLATATHAVPFIAGHPRLDDKLRSEIDSTDWQIVGKPARSRILVPLLHRSSLARVLAMAEKRVVLRGHPCP